MKREGTVQLETERLILRRFTEADAEDMYWNWTNDPEVTKFLTWPAHKCIEDADGYIRYCLEAYEEDNTYQWGIELKETGELFGNISVVSMDERAEAVELGYVIGRRFWGKGYMAEAVKAVIAYFFEKAGANRVFAKHDVNNPNSGRVMQKAGMTYEGTLRQSDWNNQGIVDCAVYSILKSEYQKKCFLSR